MFTRIRKDIIGLSASLLCSVHCMALPVMLIWFGVDTNMMHNHIFDMIFLVIGIIFIATSIVPSIKKTGHVGLILLTAVGFLSFITSFFLASAAAHIAFAIGGLAWATAHFINIALHKKAIPVV